MSKLISPLAILRVITSLTSSVSSAPADLRLAAHNNPPSFRDETIAKWCVLLINGTVIPDAPDLYLWAVRNEAVGWYACPSDNTPQIFGVAPSSSSSDTEQRNSKGLAKIDAWWPYPPPPKKPGLKNWNNFRKWPQTHLGVFPNWQTHQPVTEGRISPEGLKLEEERRLRRPWLSSVEEWENWQLPLPVPEVFGSRGEDEDGEGEGETEEEWVFGLLFSGGDGDESERRLSKVKRDVLPPFDEEKEKEYVRNAINRLGAGLTALAEKLTEAVTADSSTRDKEVNKDLSEEHRHEQHYHHHEEIKEDAAAREQAEGHEDHEGHHHGPMCNWSFWEAVIGVLIILAGLWWFLVRRGRAGLGGLKPAFTLHKPAWMSSLGRAFDKENRGEDTSQAKITVTV